MSTKTLVDFAEAVIGHKMPEWQRRILVDLDAYYARAAVLGIPRDQASRHLSARMEAARERPGFHIPDVIEAAKRALVE